MEPAIRRESEAYQLGAGQVGNSQAFGLRGTLATESDVWAWTDVNEHQKSRGTVAIGSGATGDDAAVQPEAPVPPPDAPTVFEVAPFGQHPPVENTPPNAQSAMPGVAAPYVPPVAAPYVPPAPETSTPRAAVVSFPAQGQSAPSDPGRANVAAHNQPSAVGVNPMAQQPSPQPPFPPSPEPARGAELIGGSSASVYEFSGTDDGRGGPGAADTFGGAPELNISVHEAPHQTNLHGGGMALVFVVLAVVLGGGVAGFLWVNAADEAEAAEPAEPAVAATPAAEKDEPEATPAEPDSTPVEADPAAAPPAEPAAAAGTAPGADPAATPPADAPKADAPKPAAPKTTKKKTAKKKSSGSKKSIKPKKPPRKDPFKGLPTPPG